jgi:hypothetical protein
LSISGSVPGHALRTEMDRALRKIGMTMGFVTPQTTKGVLMNLEAAGLVVRRLPPEHGRVL